MSFSNSQAYTTTVPSKDGQAPATGVSTTAANPIPQAPTAQTTDLKQPNTINQTTSGSQVRVNNMGHRVGEGVRGAWNIVHGAGEVLRGNVNSALDGTGDVIAGRPGQSVPTRNADDIAIAQTHGSVGQAGFNEIQQGMDRFQRK